MATYTVKKGDSWARIAGRVYGDQRMFQRLQRANKGIGGLRPGMKIRLPSKVRDPYVSREKAGTTIDKVPAPDITEPPVPANLVRPQYPGIQGAAAFRQADIAASRIRGYAGTAAFRRADISAPVAAPEKSWGQFYGQGAIPQGLSYTRYMQQRIGTGRTTTPIPGISDLVSPAAPAQPVSAGAPGTFATAGAASGAWGTGGIGMPGPRYGAGTQALLMRQAGRRGAGVARGEDQFLMSNGQIVLDANGKPIPVRQDLAPRRDIFGGLFSGEPNVPPWVRARQETAEVTSATPKSEINKAATYGREQDIMLTPQDVAWAARYTGQAIEVAMGDPDKGIPADYSKMPDIMSVDVAMQLPRDNNLYPTAQDYLKGMGYKQNPDDPREWVYEDIVASNPGYGGGDFGGGGGGYGYRSRRSGGSGVARSGYATPYGLVQWRISA